MFNFNKFQTERLLAVHSYSGILLGLMLYVVVLTGSLVVFSQEIGIWSASNFKTGEPMRKPINETIYSLSKTIPEKYFDEVTYFAEHSGDLNIFFHSHEKNERGEIIETGVRFLIDGETHKVLQQQEGEASTLKRPPLSALDSFLVQLHVNLHAPEPYGLYATGLLGMVLLIAAVSGLFLHRHIIKDIFLAPRLSNKALNSRDRHNLAASWSLPFAFILAFTGAFFSFALSVGLPILAITAFGGDQQAAFEAIVDVEEDVNEQKAKMANIDDIIKKSIDKHHTTPNFVVLSHWNTQSATALINHPNTNDQLFQKQHIYNGITGDYIGIKPGLGKVESTGNNAVSLMSILHFGTFAGLLSKIIWFAAGLAICYVTITGLGLWSDRQKERDKYFLRKWVAIFSIGLPVAIAISAIGFFLAVAFNANTFYWTGSSFSISAVLITLIGLLYKNAIRLKEHLLLLLGVLFIALPLIRISCGGFSWPSLFDSANTVVIAFDLILLLAGIYCIAMTKGFNLKIQTAHKIPAE